MAKFTRVPLRGSILLGVLLVLVIVKAVSYVQVRQLERELQDIADQRIDWLRRNDWSLMSHQAETAVVASKKFIVFGPTAGKVEVYFRREGILGKPQYTEYVFHFEQQNGSWVETDSGVCQHTDCQVRAAAAFGD